LTALCTRNFRSAVHFNRLLSQLTQKFYSSNIDPDFSKVISTFTSRSPFPELHVGKSSHFSLTYLLFQYSLAPKIIVVAVLFPENRSSSKITSQSIYYSLAFAVYLSFFQTEIFENVSWIQWYSFHSESFSKVSPWIRRLLTRQVFDHQVTFHISSQHLVFLLIALLALSIQNVFNITKFTLPSPAFHVFSKNGALLPSGLTCLLVTCKVSCFQNYYFPWLLYVLHICNGIA
jgi:hypothetical protein